jgi:hypothetical protein
MSCDRQPLPGLEDAGEDVSPAVTLAEALNPDLDRAAKVKLLLAVADETMAAAFGAHDDERAELVRDALDISALADSHSLADIADSLRLIAADKAPVTYSYANRS